MSLERRCYTPGWHEAHTWTYGGTPAHCDGLNTQPDRPDTRCCADPLCPCATKPGWGAYGFRHHDTHPHDAHEGDDA